MTKQRLALVLLYANAYRTPERYCLHMPRYTPLPHPDTVFLRQTTT